MKFYNPRKKNSFQMQFGFQSPTWNKCADDNLQRQKKSRKIK